MQSFRHTDNGGRLLQGNTPHGDYTIKVYADHDGPVFDEDGNEVGHIQMTIKSPPTPPPKVLSADQKRRMRSRLKVCAVCEHVGPIGVATVRCKKCKTCRNALSLISESTKCPLGKWGET